MNFGHFDDVNKEYVITTPDTPLPWINYLGSQDFFTLISNTCGGYSFYKDAKLLRITRYRYNNIPVDSNGKYYYIKDGDTVWNPGAMPTRTPLDVYECRHGLGYSRFHGEKNGLAADLLAFVPVDTACEINKLTLRNNSDKAKEISLFSYVEFCLWNAVDDMTNYQRNLSTGEVEIIGSTIYHKTEYRERRNHYSFFTVNTPVDGFDTSRDEFLGLGRGNNAPIVVEEGKSHNSVASGWYPIASQQINVSLAPGEEKEYVFLLGYCENPKDDKWEALNVIKKEPAKKIMEKFETSEQVNEAFAILNTYWDDLLSRYQVAGHKDVIIADEAQFLTPQQIDQLRQIVDEADIPVLCFGLRTDFLTHLFPGSQRLMELADSITEIKTICSCGAKATVNARLDPQGNILTQGSQVFLGGNDSYVAMCHRCWRKKIQSQQTS